MQNSPAHDVPLVLGLHSKIIRFLLTFVKHFHPCTVEPEFYDTPFYDHLSYTTSFSGTDDL